MAQEPQRTYYGPLPDYLQSGYANDPRRAIAAQLLESGASAKPIGSIWEGLGRLFAGYAGGKAQHRVSQEYQQKGEAYRTAIAEMLKDPNTSYTQAAARIASVDPDSAIKYQLEGLQQRALQDRLMAQQAAIDKRFVEGQNRQDARSQQATDRTLALFGLKNDATLAQNQARTLPPEETASLGFPQGAVVEETPATKEKKVLYTPPAATVAGTKAGRFTEGESKTVAYGVRARQAADDVQKIEAAGYNPANLRDRALTRIGGEPGNVAKTPEGQVYETNAKKFVAAILRKDSGAQITEKEWEREYPTYFPVYGDKPETIAAKAMLRKQAIQALEASGSDAVREAIEKTVPKIPLLPEAKATPASAKPVAKKAAAKPAAKPTPKQATKQTGFEGFKIRKDLDKVGG